MDFFPLCSLLLSLWLQTPEFLCYFFFFNSVFKHAIIHSLIHSLNKYLLRLNSVRYSDMTGPALGELTG